MSIYILIGIAAAVVVLAGLFFLTRVWNSQLAKKIARDPHPLAVWTYTPEEWQQAVADEFTWARARGNSATIKICQLGFLVDDGSRARLYDLETSTRLVTFAGYVPIEGGLLKLRVRQKIELGNQNDPNETKYYKDDYRIPVPLREQEEAQKVVDFFMSKMQNNLDAYTDLIADNESISLFGNDSF